GFTVHGAHEPHFVLSIDPSKNEIVVGGKDELATYEFDTENFNAFLSRDEILNMPGLGVKIRYRSAKLPVKISPREGGGVHAVLSAPAAGIAPAQLAVFYDERDRVIASGFIK
ncbi:aminomethyltransferase beta-barrel domain-containing protein, partial [uncultured Campylobacter sp.]|uniref:aminomethyltransferase beta-barrel domain-containing protein n=1 Tax=uncultured Campylobacter sp. TaxID=218934 RepID=UPI00345523BB